MLEIVFTQLVSLDRETNKAFCGFIDQSKYCQYKGLFQVKGLHEAHLYPDENDQTSRNHLEVQIIFLTFFLVIQWLIENRISEG